MAALATGLIYGTFARNRWGISTNNVSCPSCNAPLSRVRQPQSFRQAMWGGWVCPNCGVQTDKWGRKLSVEREQVPEVLPNGEETHQQARNASFRQLRGRSWAFWVLALVFVALNVLYDYYSPRAIVFDIIAVLAFLGWHRKSRHAGIKKTQ